MPIASRCLALRMPLLVHTIALLLVAGNAQAIDCNKAEDAADKVVCASPKLRALASQLDEVYQEALEHSDSPDALEREQHRWLNGRANYLSAGLTDIEGQYQNRILALKCIPWRGRGNAPLKLDIRPIPTYPDVWEYSPKPASLALGMAVLLPDGDVGLPLFMNAHDPTTSYIASFNRLFSDKPLTLEDECRIALRVNGARVGSATLANGTIIDSDERDWGDVCFTKPYNEVRILQHEPSRNEPMPKRLASAHLLYLLNKPAHWEPTDVTELHCDQTPINYRVTALFPDMYLPLPDGTVLAHVYLGEGNVEFIIRLDSTLHTKARLLEGKLFVVDDATYSKWLKSIQKAGRDQDFYLNADIENALYKHVMELKGGSGVGPTEVIESAMKSAEFGSL